MNTHTLLINALFLFAALHKVAGHGFMAVPAARNVGNDCEHCLSGGGVPVVQAADVFGGGNWSENYPETDINSIRHGLCGDPPGGSQVFINQARPVATYQSGQSIEITVKISAHHHGWFEFKICDLSTTNNGELSQSCLNQHLLQRDPSDSSISPIDTNYPSRYYMLPLCHPDAMEQKMMYLLPQGLSCKNCVLQWWWVTANTCHGGGYDGVDFPETFQNANGVVGRFDDPNHCSSGDGNSKGWYPRANSECSAIGAGYPEEFWNCADIVILAPGETAAPTASSAECADMWAKCGGEGWDGPACCKGNGICQEQSQWYHQCVPSTTPTTLIMPSPTPASTPVIVSTAKPTTTAPISSTKMPTSTDAPTPLSSTSKPTTETNVQCGLLWSQCGGSEWSGSTCCVEGAICTRSNEWYSQCLDDPQRTCRNIHEECGDGHPSCCSAYKCQAFNQYYSQCILKNQD